MKELMIIYLFIVLFVKEVLLILKRSIMRGCIGWLEGMILGLGVKKLVRVRLVRGV